MSARPPTSTRTRTPLPCPTLFRCSCDPTNIEAYARAMALPGRTRGGMEWYRALAADHAAALAYKKQPLEMPVLGLGGDQRFGAQMVPMLKEFATNVTGGSIARCSHYVADERPDEVAAALIAFLKAK